MTDIDNIIKFWIEDIPYIYISDGTIEKTYRYYILQNWDQVVYKKFGRILVPIIYMRLINMMYTNQIDKDDNLYMIKLRGDCETASNYFLAYNMLSREIDERYLEKLDIRINGKKIKNDDIVMINNYGNLQTKYFQEEKEEYNIIMNRSGIVKIKTINSRLLGKPFKPINEYPEILRDYVAHYYEDERLNIPTYDDYYSYLVTVYQEYPTAVENNNEIKNIYNTPYRESLLNLIKKRIRNIGINKLKGLLENMVDDKSIYYELRKYMSGTQEKWGTELKDIKGITGRTESRIKEFLPYKSEFRKDFKARIKK